MSFPCSLFKFTKRSHKIIANYVKYNFIFISSNVQIDKKYVLKKLVRDLQKTMQAKYDSNLLSPPECIRGLKVLDKSIFKKEIQLPTIILDNVIISKVMPHLRKYLLKMENLRPMQTEINKSEDNKDVESKYVLLNPLFVKQWSDISEKEQKGLISLGISEQHFKTINFTINYDNWKADELLRYIIPEDKQSVAGFSKIGHIIHLNLRDHVLEYKEIIGEILLHKISGVRTVVNKLDKIDNTYRFFEMEILCGDKDMNVQVKENHCIFDFDFSTVYWNPRLSTEHERIVNLLKPGNILYDVFAGVGPFAIPAAKKKCSVLANDLNPESFKWLNHNAKVNKIKDGLLKTFNKDGRDFILNELKTDLKKRFENNNTDNIYITMNLPALAPEFLPSFVNLFSKSELENIEIKSFPKVFVYCFAKGEDSVQIARDLVEKHLSCSLPENYKIFNVRKVSNYKEMMRVSFELNRDILCGNLCKKRGPEDDGMTTEIKKCCAMGKNKGKQKVKNVFKVAGAKSLKLKAKAKTVNSQLKKINIKTKEKVIENNKQLEQLENAVRQTTTLVKKEDRKVKIKKNAEESQKQINELQKLSDKNLEEMKSMKMT